MGRPERIKEDADYEGVRVKVIATLGKIRKTLQFDIDSGALLYLNRNGLRPLCF